MEFEAALTAITRLKFFFSFSKQTHAFQGGAWQPGIRVWVSFVLFVLQEEISYMA